jgi:hypothetical protein
LDWITMTPLSNFRNLTGLCIPNSPNRSHKMPLQGFRFR